MVWGLFPSDSLSGDDKYYIYSKGTFTVGRKGCDVNITNDKSVSRVHAEIIIDEMLPMEPLDDNTCSSQVRIRDCSKYGTFVSRNSHARKRVADCPAKQLYLNDGDLISFGTGNGSYRFSYVPLNIYMCNFTSSQGTPLLDKVSSIGAFVMHKWTTGCTHAIVDPFMPVTEDIIDVILSKKPLVLTTWLELVAATRINNDLPSCTQFFPTLTLDGRSVTVADTRARDICLKGYTFVLGSANMYRFQERVQLLLEVAGAKVLTVEDVDSKNQDLEAYNSVVFVNPADTTVRIQWGSSLRKVNELNLIFSVISGYLDPSIFVTPSIVVSSSSSTDETVVADSDAELETATSNHPTMTNAEAQNASNEKKTTLEIHSSSMSKDDLRGDSILHSNMKTIRGREGTERLCKEEESSKQDASALGDGKFTRFLQLNRKEALSRNDDFESSKGDVLYSQNLFVKSDNLQVVSGSITADGVVNFKLFRKIKTQSGNSFNNLVPFSKYPYTDSDYDNEVSEFVKEEKKRKKMEAMAEDLFNHERRQGRQHGAAGSLQALARLR